MKKSSKIWSIVIAGSFATALGLVLSRRPVLLRFTEPGEIARPTASIFNPMRNRAPEHVVEAIFDELRRGEVREAIGRLRSATGDDIAEKERLYRLRRWKLVDRIDDAGMVTLFYRTDRGASGQLDSEVTVRLRRQKTGWVVSEYLPMY